MNAKLEVKKQGYVDATREYFIALYEETLIKSLKFKNDILCEIEKYDLLMEKHKDKISEKLFFNVLREKEFILDSPFDEQVKKNRTIDWKVRKETNATITNYRISYVNTEMLLQFQGDKGCHWQDVKCENSLALKPTYKFMLAKSYDNTDADIQLAPVDNFSMFSFRTHSNGHTDVVPFEIQFKKGILSTSQFNSAPIALIDKDSIDEFVDKIIDEAIISTFTAIDSI